MPTAQSFTFVGNPSGGFGTGFPACLTKVDVSSYDYWTTFSGVNKDSPTASESLVNESLTLAMKIFWNLNSMDVTCTYTDATNNRSVSDVTMGETENESGITGSPQEPMDRVCPSSFQSWYNADPDTGFFFNVEARLTGRSGRIVRLYNGAATDESNFVGYGASDIRTNFDSFVFAGGMAGFPASSYCNVQLGGYANEINTSSLDEDYQYVEFGGMHFVCGAVAASSAVTSTIDASTLYATAAYLDGGFNVTSEVQLNALDFYTY